MARGRRPPDTAAAVRRAQFTMLKRARRFCITLAIEAYKKMSAKTPKDQGIAKANWMIGLREVDTTTVNTKAREPLGTAHGIARATQKLAEFRLGDTIYITNSLPYIRALEYGEYPNPPKKGTWVKGQGYVIKSEGGFSKQAPSGMVGVTLSEIRQIAMLARLSARDEQLSSRIRAAAMEGMSELGPEG